MMAKKSFILYLDQLEVLDALTDEQVGKLFRAIKAFQSGEDVEPYLTEQIVRVVFIQFKGNMLRDNRKYDEICERNRENGKKGGRPKTQENPKNPVGFSKTQKTQVVFNETQKNPEKPDNDNDNDNDNDIIEKKKSNKRKKEPPGGVLFPDPQKPIKKKNQDDFVPPTLIEVEAVFRQSSNELPNWQDEARIFFYHYDGLGWRNTHGVKIRNWDSFANKWIFDKINESKKNKQPPNRNGDRRTTTGVDPECGLIEPRRNQAP